jgi:hypothetical protein
MARIKSSRRVNPVGTAVMVWGLWRRLPKRQRKWVLTQARKHGPRIARQVYASRRPKR